MKILFLSLSILFLLACGTKQKVFEIAVDPKNTGWYFVEVKANNAEDQQSVIKVRFDPPDRYRQISAKHFDQYLFRAYDLDGNEISKRMKLAGTLSHYSGRKFFKFYNPTDKELSEVKDWLPTNADYQQVQYKATKELEILLQANKR